MVKKGVVIANLLLITLAVYFGVDWLYAMAVNRINSALRNEAYNCMTEGVASIEDIDKALKLALRHPMGPFELADFVGLDVGLAVARTLHDGYKDVKWRPNLTLEKLVQSGDLGRKTGKGWYDYTSGEKKPRTDADF